MSRIVGRSFSGFGLDLKELGIENERPDGNYLDEQLSSGVFTCISGDGRLYYGITPCFPWEPWFADMPKDENEAKRKIAMKLLEYLTEERTRLEEDPEEYEEALEDELPKVDNLIAKVEPIDDGWTELW